MRILVVFGTRPEAIKMAPVINKLKETFADGVKVCVTAQHRHMLDQVLALFEIVPDYDLDIMKNNQTLSDTTCGTLRGIEGVIDEFQPHLVLVHGDTTTTFTASLAAFYQKKMVGHVEAGLRSYNKFAPWPEEMNRKLTGCLADLHFAPTEAAAHNLRLEGVSGDKIFVTGNTVVDALIEVRRGLEADTELKATLEKQFSYLDPKKKLILVTGHRRENFGQGLAEICQAIAELAKRDDVQMVYPVHLNPNVETTVTKILGDSQNVFLIKPQDYLVFTYLMERCYFILTDSGGIQEEAPTFKKPVLVMREVTERTEALNAGMSKLVGTSAPKIIQEVSRLLDDAAYYDTMRLGQNPFGDGEAAARIVDVILAVAAR